MQIKFKVIFYSSFYILKDILENMLVKNYCWKNKSFIANDNCLYYLLLLKYQLHAFSDTAANEKRFSIKSN